MSGNFAKHLRKTLISIPALIRQPGKHALSHVAALTLLMGFQFESYASEGDIITACRCYLNEEGGEGSSAVAEIAAYEGDIDKVVSVLSRSGNSDRQDLAGALTAQAFTCPDLKATYAQDMLHYYVPDAYTPSRPYGLIIFMHGGGRTTPREHAAHVVTHPDSDPESIGLQPHFADLPFIIVAPSAPWNETTGARWNVPGADDYVSAVIQECCYRFNVDRDRVFLGGYSMGGFGAFHLCQRLSDRLAGGFVFSGAWKTTHWKAWTGTPLFIRHGANDAAPSVDGKPGRPRFTDVFYARTAHRRLTELGIPHVYVEDNGNHAIRPAADAMTSMATWVLAPKRDPDARHVVAISPRGWKSSSDTATPHNRWITIHEPGDGEIAFDHVTLSGPSPSFHETPEDFRKQTFQLDVLPVRAGLVDATIQGRNRIVIHTENVKKFSIWLNRSMVDFSQPVRISLNGSDSEHLVAPRLLDTLRSYKRRQDWGLIYHAEIELTCTEE